jgi:hypothetical protein
MGKTEKETTTENRQALYKDKEGHTHGGKLDLIHILMDHLVPQTLSLKPETCLPLDPDVLELECLIITTVNGNEQCKRMGRNGQAR